ncbi:hypothetical protein RF11_08763 [Thelohanellus kitauei]|uniref:Uncharacterized protein n=1 Tax=Thelohanellus kitauei TaxID=669202 RepID=A0A0C2MJQ0_THEKT|nr:hypothetical protein RF11_08289 [Thelohanellus kitauei]KII71268.1 hypothetical protein RF11_08763 [Thelohanellus kitauei]
MSFSDEDMLSSDLENPSLYNEDEDQEILEETDNAVSPGDHVNCEIEIFNSPQLSISALDLEAVSETLGDFMADQTENDNCNLTFDTLKLIFLFLFPSVRLRFKGDTQAYEHKHFQDVSLSIGRKKFIGFFMAVLSTILHQMDERRNQINEESNDSGYYEASNMS